MFFGRKHAEQLNRIEEKIDKMASSTGAGLQSLETEDTEIDADVTANTTATQALLTQQTQLTAQVAALTLQLQNVPAGDPDSQVAAIAADLDKVRTQLEATNAGISAALAPSTEAPSGS